jgi:hypothetical protein
VSGLCQSRRLGFLNPDKSGYNPAGIGRTLRRGHLCFSVPWLVSPHPGPLPWGEGQGGETARTLIPRIGQVQELSNWASPPAELEVIKNDQEGL